MEDPTQLLANPRNWRMHSGRQRDAIRGALGEVGWVQQIIVNTTTGHVVDGHMRVEEAISAEATEVPVVYVELTEEEEALVLATLDPMSAMAGQSDEALAALLSDITVDDEALAKMLGQLAKDDGDAYTDTVKVPRYEPSEETPEVSQLMDDAKAEELREAIRAAKIPADVEAFLLAAASRHTVFQYSRIADYYAAAPAEVQELMEASALVIIDYEDAIQNGYVRFVEAISEQEELDSGD